MKEIPLARSRGRGAVGGLVGTGIAGAAGWLLLGQAPVPELIAPIGASAVLVFAVPASPLAQPWPVVGGSLISAACGLVIGHVIGQLLGLPLMAAALAVGVAIGTMSLARCLHPPGGACALLYALGATGTETWGRLHLATIAVNVFALAAAGWAFNNLTGHSWPHRPVPIPAPTRHAAAVHRALSEVLAEWDEVIDADIEDLDAIFLAVERRVRTREQNVVLPPTNE